MSQTVLVLDFGGPYKELIARAVRGLGVYSEIKPGHMKAAEVKALNPIGVILTGAPGNALADGMPSCDPELFRLGVPVLGVDFGMHVMCRMLGGEVQPCEQSEAGMMEMTAETSSALFFEIEARCRVLMNHADRVVALPNGFSGSAQTESCPYAAFEAPGRKLYGVQFHPETEHSEAGSAVLRNFLYRVCGAAGDYHLDGYIESQIRQIREKVGDQRILLALSGGVDSSVCASLLSRAVPGQLTCIFVDHGCMRMDEGDEIERAFANQDLRLIRVNAQDRFLAKLKGVTDPEVKRKRIGEEFIRVFEEEALKLGDVPFLAQGTIYPDIVESGGELGATIKSHHNVGGLPETLSFTDLVEPLAGLFKDEVRVMGRKLGLPKSLVERQPFPGPGLAVRVMGEVTKEKLDLLRLADRIVRQEIDKLKNRPQQYFAIYTDARSVGVKDDRRTYDNVIAVRAVMTTDFMTCEYAALPHRLLGRIASRITGEIEAVSRVVYDITSKPPGTVEWE